MLRAWLPFWFVLAVLAVANGVLRQATYGTALPELAAHQLSTLTGIALTGAAAWLYARRFPLSSSGTARLIGVCWLAMTIAFEFGFGRYVAGHPWSALLHDYNVLEGRIWILFLVWILALPSLVYLTQRRL